MAEVSNKAESIEHLITCGVCLEILDKPVIFPCIHHFCKKCKAQLNKTEQDRVQGVLCPTCRQFAADEMIRDNFVMEQLVELHIEKSSSKISGKMCDTCMKQTPRHRCLECKIEICQDCYLFHSRIPSCKGHMVKELGTEGKESQNVINTIVFCSEHQDKIIEFSCVECNKAICYKCKILKHDKHSTSTIEDAIDQLLPKIEQKLLPVTEDITYLTDKIKRLEKLDKYTKDRKEHLLKEIETTRAQMVEKVNRDAAKLSEEIEIKFQAKRKEITLDKSDKMHQLSSRESIQTWASTVLGHLQDINLLLQLQGELMSTLNHYQNKLSNRKEQDVAPIELQLQYNEHRNNIIAYLKYEKLVYSGTHYMHNSISIDTHCSIHPAIQQTPIHPTIQQSKGPYQKIKSLGVVYKNW